MDFVVEFMIPKMSRFCVRREISDLEDLLGFFSSPVCGDEQLGVFNLT